MQFTILGLVTAALSLLLLARPYSLLGLILATSAFEAAAAATAGSYGLQPALIPTSVLLGYFTLQISQGLRFTCTWRIISTIWPFGIVVLWALTSSFILPRLFAGRFLIWPQRQEWPFLQVPLAPTAGNLTQDFYIILDLLCLIVCALLSSRKSADTRTILRGWWTSGYIAALLALWQLASHHSSIPFPEDALHSNPGWAQLSSQEIVAGTARINGSFSEPASLASFLIQFVFALGWATLRGHRLRSLVALLILSIVVIVVSTSSTGLLVLALLCFTLMLLTVLARDAAMRRRARLIVVIALVISGPLIISSTVFAPQVARTMLEIVSATLSKDQSDSYRDRTNTDIDSLTLLIPSYGLGVGWGSNRSSSLLPGVVASLGVIGLVGLAVFVVRITRLVKRSLAFKRNDAEAICTEVAIAGCIGEVVAGLISGPSIITVYFYILLGLAIGSAARCATSIPMRRAELASLT